MIAHFSQTSGVSVDELHSWYKSSQRVEISTMTDDKEIKTYHEMKNATSTSTQGNILIPIREAILLLGQTIEWDSKTKTITVTGKLDYNY